jgi:hypothetical protein
MKKILLSFLPTLLIPVLGFSQVTKERDVIASGGEESVTPSLQIAWTVGETAINYSENTNLIVSEGFEQGEIGDVGFTENEFLGEFTVYPNPASDNLFFDIQADQEFVFSGEMYDETGRIVLEIPPFTVNGSYTDQIEMLNFPAGKWTLRFVTSDGKISKTFSVIKVN